MTITEEFLKNMKMNIGVWYCGKCAAPRSTNIAGTFREVKKLGYKFEEVSMGRWAKMMFCVHCNKISSHYKLLSLIPTFQSKNRFNFNRKTRERILRIFQNKDAFTGRTITSVAEIDHKVPWTRLEKDIDATALSDEEIKQHFQLLSREHNLIKDRACGHCRLYNERPPFLEIPFWYHGNSNYCGTCYGCGWYDGVEWRRAITGIIEKYNSLDITPIK